MRYGLWLPRPGSRETLDPLVAFVQEAEARGLASLWVGEHAVCFEDPESFYPYGEGGRWDLGVEENWLEPFAFLSYLAACTSRIRLGTGVVIVPQRHPVYTAKSVSTVDYLSRGRLDFGVGVGWSREEFEALGIPWEGRGARCREYIAVMRALWSEPMASHSGPLYELPPSSQRPPPLQRPHPPLYFGGESTPALRRVAELGDGWFGWFTAEQAPDRVGRLRELIAEAGRAPGDVDVSVGCPWPDPRGPIDADAARAYADAGVDQLLLAWPGAETDAEAVARLDELVALLGDPLHAPAVMA
jgi:probable F420-dependent oxidoreductase